MAKDQSAIPIGFDYVNQTLPLATKKNMRASIHIATSSSRGEHIFPSQPGDDP